MLWTVFRDLPFEQRLENVAKAGYTNVELVGEYAKWSPADFDRANAARKRLGITFDATAGLGHGVANPADRDAFLADLRQALVPMETLGCPAMIVLSGNVVPGLSREAQHQSSIDGLKRAAALVEGRKINGQPVRILLECIDPEENPKYFLTSAAEAIEIVRAVNHPQVQFLYDLFHEQIGEGNLIEKLEKNIDVIGLIHIADVPGRHKPGTGEINYAQHLPQARRAQIPAHGSNGIPAAGGRDRRTARSPLPGRNRQPRMITFTGQSMAALPNGNNRRRMDWGNKRPEGRKAKKR